MVSNKSWYTSKTLWVNVLAIAVMIAEYLIVNKIYSPEIHALVLATINLGLRIITKTGLTK